MRTTTTPRYESRARFSASDRPTPPDFDVEAAMSARRARRTSHATERDAPTVSWAQRFASFAARLTGVRRSATVALSLLLATGVGDAADDDASQRPGS
ncbi:MAG: hypothetical protein ABI601_01945 [bacterium]